MRTQPFVTGLVLGVLCLLGSSIKPAYACDCISLTAQEKFDRADVVLIGTVDSQETTVDLSGHAYTHTGITVKVLYKGTDLNGVIFIISPGYNCDVTFVKGKEYVVYAQKLPADKYGTSVCSGTKSADRIEDDERRILGEKTPRVK